MKFQLPLEPSPLIVSEQVGVTGTRSARQIKPSDDILSMESGGDGGSDTAIHLPPHTAPGGAALDVIRATE